MSRHISLRPSYLLHAATIFLSAFLVFQIQPVVGKYLLPWFGGSTSVWATSLLFFTTALSLGYFYVFILSFFARKVQILVHTCVLSISSVFVGTALVFRSQLVISLDWTLETNMLPSLVVLIVLAASVGLPYVVLTSTSPLVQHWFGITQSREPFKLYALSNIGSFLALISYPIFFERVSTLTQQQKIWGYGFLIFTLLCLALCMYTYKTLSPMDNFQEKPPTPMYKDNRWVSWILYSAFPSFLLVAVTAVITQKIAPIPLLWIVPLSLYLASFIFSFSGYGSGKPTLLIFVVSIAFIVNASLGNPTAYELIFGAMIFLYAASLLCHARVYQLRPQSDFVPFFYLTTSTGGALGALVGSIIPPLVFNDIEEINVALFMAVAIAIISIARHFHFHSRRFFTPTYRMIIVVLIASCVVVTFPTNGRFTVSKTRNFYGVNEIKQNETLSVIENNSTVHGIEFRDPQLSKIATTYYNTESGVGQALSYAQKESPSPINVGVIGLGSGTLASYCKPGDSFTFYEIDSHVEALAQEYFTFLDQCKNSSVIIGDGRIQLEHGTQTAVRNAYDVFVVDAFTGGSIPTHLITKEALELYTQNLRNDQSIIAFHISNRYLDLKGVVDALGKDAGYKVVIAESPKNDTTHAFTSTWMLLAKDASVFNSPAFKEATELEASHSRTLWTDEKTNILSILTL